MDQKNDRKALDQLYSAAGRQAPDGDLREMFQFVRRLPALGAYNAGLVFAQRPGSTFVATRAAWVREFGRHPKAGARPLIVLRPFGPVEFVFDVADTEGEPVPDRILHPFKTSGSITDEGYRGFIRHLVTAHVAYREESYGPNMAGQISRASHRRTESRGSRNFELKYDLVVNAQQSAGEKLSTVAHELGHLFCGHLGAAREDTHPDREEVSSQTAEFEAESVAWLVCGQVGISIPAGNYLSGYLRGDGEVPPVSKDTILKAVGMIENLVGGSVELGTIIRNADQPLLPVAELPAAELSADRGPAAELPMTRLSMAEPATNPLPATGTDGPGGYGTGGYGTGGYG